LTIFKRYSKNPILTPTKNNWWESKAVFNCTASYDGKNIHMLYRAIGEYDNYISRIGYASSSDGFNFSRRNNPAIFPTEEYEIYGMEDPRATQIGDKIFVTYVVLSDYVKSFPKVFSALAVTKDYTKFKKLGIITKNFHYNKNVTFFPEKFKLGYNLSNNNNGYYLILHRPDISTDLKTIRRDIWLSITNSVSTLNDSIILLKPEQDWENLKIGTGPSPIKTRKGWLLIYHGVSTDRIYRIGAALLDLKDPRKVIARTKQPLLEPVEKYEKLGDVNNVVFPTGAVVIDKKILLYYGGADKVCCIASANLDELIEYITKDTISD
jgi:beta-1,2-mannobiose phosphorylase / 1,2-beta-oligomannan phosphorylase